MEAQEPLTAKYLESFCDKVKFFQFNVDKYTINEIKSMLKKLSKCKVEYQLNVNINVMTMKECYLEQDGLSK